MNHFDKLFLEAMLAFRDGWNAHSAAYGGRGCGRTAGGVNAVLHMMLNRQGGTLVGQVCDNGGRSYPEREAIVDRVLSEAFRAGDQGRAFDMLAGKRAIRDAFDACPASPVVDAAALAALIVRDVAELPDRDSPEGWPDAMLVTGDELINIIKGRLAEAATEG